MQNRTARDDRFRLAVDASPAAMIMVDADGLIEFANAETERMFGYSVEELIGRSIDLLVPTRLRGSHAGLRRGFFDNPSNRPMGAGRDLNGTRKDGAEFPVEIALTPIDAESGPIVLATVVDITARTQAEMELARRASELELANERLAHFAYVASHDLQEPLRKIAVFAGLLAEAVERAETADVARATTVISTSAVRARRLVENLLTFSRVTSGETRVQPLDLRAEVESVLNDLSASVEESGAQVLVTIPPVLVPADRMQLGRLIQNIISNAIKYHKPGAAPGIRILTTVLSRTKIRLSIVDDGIGFEEKFAREIFEPFKRLHDLKQYPGSGIGLAICKAIADRHGWTLAVNSRPGEGAAFHVTLPAAAQQSMGACAPR
jgi:PAS domain S-box-containing protein